MTPRHRSPRHALHPGVLRENAIGRREAIKRIGAVAGAAALAPLVKGCSDASSSSSNQLTPESLGLETLVVVMMENRSFDHYLGSLSLLEGRSGVDGLQAGFTNPTSGGAPVGISRSDIRCVTDPPHGFTATHRQVNGGVMDGFVRENEASNGEEHADEVMGYHVRSQIPFTYGLADEFVTCDRWFCSVQGPTWPNRFYLHSAQSNGRKNNNFPEDPEGFKWPTIYDTLDRAGIPWKYYYIDLPFLALFASLRAQTNKIVPFTEFFEDAQAGTLPPVAVVDPGFLSNDDHPPHDIRLGQAFLSSVVHGLGQSPQWSRSMFVLTYDEHGGFFDHVAPPTVEDERADEGFGDLGVRVPSLVASPFAKSGRTDSTVYEHSSVAAFIEWWLGLEPLTVRDANANIFLESLDAERVRREDPRPFPALPIVEVDPDDVPAECIGVEGVGAQDIADYADAGGIPASLDRRRETGATLRTISRELLRMGAGRRGR